MSIFLDDINNWLVAQSLVGGSTGWAVSEGFLPPEPDQVVALFETPGEAPDIVRDPNIGEEPAMAVGLQVRLRGSTNAYAPLRAQAQKIFNGLHQNEPVIPGGNKYIYVYSKTAGPLPMGKDSNNRDELVWNFSVLMTYEPGFDIPAPSPRGSFTAIIASGLVTMANGVATVFTPFAVEGMQVLTTPQDLDSIGEARLDPSTIVPGVSFGLQSIGAFDSGVILWAILRPGT